MKPSEQISGRVGLSLRRKNATISDCEDYIAAILEYLDAEHGTRTSLPLSDEDSAIRFPKLVRAAIYDYELMAEVRALIEQATNAVRLEVFDRILDLPCHPRDADCVSRNDVLTLKAQEIAANEEEAEEENGDGLF